MTGIGTVVSGTVFSGRINIKDKMLLGPDSLGEWQVVEFKGIHNKRYGVCLVKPCTCKTLA